jgi:glycosyltransferase involved in cell wall biosynthesis
MGRTPGSKGKIAFCIGPVLSGVTTIYRTLGEGLRRSGWEVVGVSAGAGYARVFDPRVVDQYYQILSPESTDVCHEAAEFVRWVEEQNVDIVYCWEQPFSIAAAPALPPRVRRVTRSCSITSRSFDQVTRHLDRTARIVIEVPRQQRELIRKWKVPPEKIALVPGGVDINVYSPSQTRDFQGTLRLIYLGRLDDTSKGIMMLPKIAAQLVEAGVEFHLDIIGDGPDRARLQEACGVAKLRDRVTVHGFLPHEEVLAALHRAHVFLLMSRYENHSWALMETMACGCAPIVSWIVGATDSVVQQGINGFLCPVGKVSAFSKAIISLARDRKRLEDISAAAVRTIHEGFTLAHHIRDHEALFTAMLAEEPIAYPQIPVTAIKDPNLSGPTWRRWVPQGVKNYMRTWAERLHWSI